MKIVVGFLKGPKLKTVMDCFIQLNKFGRIDFLGNGLITKKIPTGKIIMHSCDNPPCVNPFHLKVGTHLENAQDAAQKQRRGFSYYPPDGVINSFIKARKASQSGWHLI